MRVSEKKLVRGSSSKQMRALQILRLDATALKSMELAQIQYRAVKKIKKENQELT